MIISKNLLSGIAYTLVIYFLQACKKYKTKE